MQTLKQVSPRTINESGLLPKGRAVLLRTYEPAAKSSIIFIPETVKEKTMMVEMRGIVIAIGPEAWKDEASPRAQVGDKVMFSRWCGNIVTGTADGKLYRMVNAEDIFCQIEVDNGR